MKFDLAKICTLIRFFRTLHNCHADCDRTADVIVKHKMFE